MNQELLALVCPDWQTSALVLNGMDGRVTYANLRCLRMLESSAQIKLLADRLVFRSPEFDRRFYVALQTMLKCASEVTVLIWNDETDDSSFSLTMKNPQGFFRDVLARSLGWANSSGLIIVEFAHGTDISEPAALNEFAAVFSLAPAEADVVRLAAQGLTLQQIASKKGLAVSTVRQRMKVVLEKTHCHRQLDLVRLVLTLCPPRCGLGPR